MPRYAKKTDSSQASIVKDLRDCGIPVVITNMGNHFPDFLVDAKDGWVLVELKELDGTVSRGQIRFLADARGFVGVAVGFEQAKALAVDPKRHAITDSQKNVLAEWLVRNPSQESVRIKKFMEMINAS